MTLLKSCHRGLLKNFRFWLLGLQPASWRASLNKAYWQVPIHPVRSYSNMALTNLTPNIFFFFFQTAQLLQAIELGVFKKEINKVTAEHDEHGSSHADILVHAMYIAPRTKKVPQMLNACYTIVKSGDKQNSFRNIKAAFQHNIVYAISAHGLTI